MQHKKIIKLSKTEVHHINSDIFKWPINELNVHSKAM